MYIPTYYTGDWLDNGQDVDSAAHSIPTYQNGLKSGALDKKQYDTIITYSGGTATAVAALDPQDTYGVTCNTLIMISPMKGTLSETDYEKKINRILEKGTVKNIVALWSPKDTPFANRLIGYQASFDNLANENPDKIKVYTVPLTKAGNEGHVEMLEFAKKTIRDGLYTPPAAVAGASNMGTQPQEPIAPAVRL